MFGKIKELTFGRFSFVELLKLNFDVKASLGSLTSGNEEKIRGKETWDKYIFMKSHFADEERLRRWRENSDKYILGSLTSQTKRDFGDGETSQTKREFGEKRLWTNTYL